MILALSGKSGSGKDTASSVLVNSYGFRRLAFADRLKMSVQAAFSLTDAQLWGDLKDSVDPYWGETPGQICQKVGTECFRKGYSEDFWIRALFRQIEPGEHYVITDVRFPNEAQAIKDWGGKIYRINRPGLVSQRPAHISESALDDWPFDGVIVNDGSTAQLNTKVVEMVLRKDVAA